MILLIGAGGYLGSILANAFTNNGEKVLTVSTSFQWENILGERRYKCSASMFDLYSDEIEQVTSIIYMAGSTDLLKAELNPADDLITHISQLHSFLDLLSSAKVKSLQRIFFFSSAGAIYGESSLSSIPKQEDFTLAPISIYGKRNMLLEDIFFNHAKKLNCQYCSVRISNPFGITQNNFRRKGLIHVLLSSAKDHFNVNLRGNGLQKRDYLFSEDFCSIIVGLTKLAVLPRELNVCSGSSLSAIDIVSIMNDLNVYPNITISPDQPSYEIIESNLSNKLMLNLLGRKVSPLTPMKNALSILLNG